MKTDIGVYIHIPFCSSKCAYCNFFSQICSEKIKKEYVSALSKQIKNYSNKITPKTVYIGGGTPSVLDKSDFTKIFSALSTVFDMSCIEEFTVEMNPESTDETLLSTLKKEGVNRISLGIQSFCDKELSLCKRRHSAAEAKNAIKKIRNAGFENISADLIIGLPGQTEETLGLSLKEMISSEVDHISSYILKIEEKTIFYAKNIKEPDEEITEKLYLKTSDFLKRHGYEHYEISNFAKNKKRGIHNSSYWQGKNYIAFGAGAYGYENKIRYHYPADISGFINSDGKPEKIIDEILSKEDLTEEKILLSLRTSDGINTSFFNKEMLSFAEILLKKGLAEIDGNRFFLTPKGFLLSNGIIAEFLLRYENQA